MQYRKYTDIQDEIIKTIGIMVQSAIKKNVPKSRDVVCIITDIKDNKYKVSIDGHDYWLNDGIGLGLSVGTSVWVRVVGGAGMSGTSGMYIASRK